MQSRESGFHALDTSFYVLVHVFTYQVLVLVNRQMRDNVMVVGLRLAVICMGGWQ